MPKYRYKCNSCEVTFFKHHSVSNILENCEHCGIEGSLNKIPTSFRVTEAFDGKVSTGQIVKKSIEEFREDLKEEKRRLKEKEWLVDE